MTTHQQNNRQGSSSTHHLRTSSSSLTTNRHKNHNHHSHHHHQHHNSTNNKAHSGVNANSKKASTHIPNGNLAPSSFDAFDIPTVSSNGMKNIEHYIDKTLVDGKQWYRCKWQNCAYATIRSDSIVRHMRKHTGERPYKCWFCSYATIQSSALKIHMRRHTGEKPYVCKYSNCGKRFAVLNTLVVHERTHTGYKPYKCTYSSSCNYSSSDRCKLVTHVRRSHQLNVDINKLNLNQTTSPTTGNGTSSSVQHQQQPSTGLSAIFQSMTNGGGGSSTGGSSIAHSVSQSQPNSSSHSLALVSGAMSSSQLLMAANHPVVYPFTTMHQNNHQTMMQLHNPHNNSSLKNSTNSSPAVQRASNLAHNNTATGSSFVPLNLLSVISGAGSYDNLQNTTTTTNANIHNNTAFPQMESGHRTQNKNQHQLTSTSSSTNKSSSRSRNNNTNKNQNKINKSTSNVDQKYLNFKEIQDMVICNNNNNNTDEIVSKEENSIKRVMNYVEKRNIGNRTSYVCKWTDCGYESLRSDSIVRHIRSHTGERPYKCPYEGCTYATIQRSSLNKHMTRHLISL